MYIGESFINKEYRDKKKGNLKRKMEEGERQRRKIKCTKGIETAGEKHTFFQEHTIPHPSLA